MCQQIIQINKFLSLAEKNINDNKILLSVTLK